MSVNGIFIFIAGWFSFGLGVFHIPPVWRLFFPGWPKEIAALSLLHRKLIDTILLALALMLFLFAFLSIGYPEELARADGLAGGLAAALAAFWLWRALWQLAYFPPSKIEAQRRPPGFKLFGGGGKFCERRFLFPAVYYGLIFSEG